MNFPKIIFSFLCLTAAYQSVVAMEKEKEKDTKQQETTTSMLAKEETQTLPDFSKIGKVSKSDKNIALQIFEKLDKGIELTLKAWKEQCKSSLSLSGYYSSLPSSISSSESQKITSHATEEIRLLAGIIGLTKNNFLNSQK